MTTRPCVWCAKHTTSPIRVCNDCIGIHNRADMVPDDTDGLTCGRWVPNHRGVQVWESAIERTDMEAS